MAGDSRIWSQLPVELQDRIMSFLETNDVACTVRLVCKAAARRYSGPQHTRTRLSQRVPAHAFAHRWGRPEPMRSLSHAERKRVLCLTAASGSIPNLQLLLPIVGCALIPDVCAAAAGAGHLDTCQWLRRQGCIWDDTVLEGAGHSGSSALLDWLIAAGCPGGAGSAMAGAASAGHVSLVDQLLASYGLPECPLKVVTAAATGCDLTGLRRLLATLVADGQEQRQLLRSNGRLLLQSAARSAAPDWRDKMQWLRAQGCRDSCACSLAAASCPDSRDRLSWLAQHGWEVLPDSLAVNAVERGDMDDLHAVFEAQSGQGGPDAELEVLSLECSVACMAAATGRLATLRYLHARGCSAAHISRCAASYGNMQVVAWLVETLGAEAVLSDALFKAAAESASLPLLTWLRERGCLCRDAGVLTSALQAGCSEEVREWLLAQGCEVQLNASEWHIPAMHGDLATLAWLRRKGCPWAANGATFTAAVAACCPMPVLRWLAEAGCPVDWEAALETARARWTDLAMLAMLEELQRQHGGEQE